RTEAAQGQHPGEDRCGRLAGVDARCGHDRPVDRGVVLDRGVVAPVDGAEVLRDTRVAIRSVERSAPQLDPDRAGEEAATIANTLAVRGGDQLAGVVLGEDERRADVAEESGNRN